MKEISDDDKKLAQAMCNAYAKKLKIRTPKTGGNSDTGNLSFSGQVAFSDTGNSEIDSGLLPEFADLRAEAALNDIRHYTIAEEVKASTKRYIQRRNDETLRSKKVIAERFTFQPHGYKNGN